MPDWCVECCWEHDIAWRTGATIDGEPRSLWSANNDFLACIAARKSWFHPRAYVRYFGVTVGATVRTIKGWFNGF